MCRIQPTYQQFRCPAGFYCARDTLDVQTCTGQDCPERCPQGLFPRWLKLTWSLGVFCPESHITGRNHTGATFGLRRIRHMDDSARLSSFICPPGYLCSHDGNHTPPVLCQPGEYCERGANASVPCRGSWFGGSTRARCPAGSTSDPGGVVDLLVVFAVACLALIIVCELFGLILRRTAARVAKKFATHQSLSFADELVGPTEANSCAAAETSTALIERSVFNAATWYDPLDGEASVKGLQASDHTPRKPLRRQSTRADKASAQSERTWQTPTLGQHREGESTQDAKRAPQADAHQAALSNTFVRLSLTGLNFRIGSAHVLKGLYAQMHEGQLVGLLGESGSGKSTLLNILSGRAEYGVTSSMEEGVEPLKLNSRRFEPRKMKTLVGFVPQAHIVYKELTVYENLLYASQMRAERRMSNTMRDRLIEMALELLGLQECTHFVCDPSIGERLSGGQMRRIGIAIELVCDPPILLLDEPTSALDAVNTRLVVAALKGLTRRGILVVASLHQPRESVFNMLEKLMLLRKGEFAFAGKAEDASSYFEELGYSNTIPNSFPARPLMNPGDFYIEVCFGLIPRFDALERDGEIVQETEEQLSRIAAKWRNQCKREQRVQRSTEKRIDEAIGLVPERRLHGLRNRMLSALRRTDSQLALFTKASDVKSAAERADLNAEINEFQDANQKMTKRDWLAEYDRRYGGMLQDEVGHALYDKAKKRAIEREHDVRRKNHGHHAGDSGDSGMRRGSMRWDPNIAERVLPLRADLAYEMEHWEMPLAEMPGWTLHFVVCLKRRAKKIIRKRATIIYLKVAFVSLVTFFNDSSSKTKTA